VRKVHRRARAARAAFTLGNVRSPRIARAEKGYVYAPGCAASDLDGLLRGTDVPPGPILSHLIVSMFFLRYSVDCNNCKGSGIMFNRHT